MLPGARSLCNAVSAIFLVFHLRGVECAEFEYVVNSADFFAADYTKIDHNKQQQKSDRDVFGNGGGVPWGIDQNTISSGAHTYFPGYAKSTTKIKQYGGIEEYVYQKHKKPKECATACSHYIRDYQIEVAQDGKTWTNAYKNTSKPQPYATTDFSKGNIETYYRPIPTVYSAFAIYHDDRSNAMCYCFSDMLSTETKIAIF